MIGLLLLWSTGCLIHPDIRDSELARFDTAGVDTAAFDDCQHTLTTDQYVDGAYPLGSWSPSELPITLCGRQSAAGDADWISFEPDVSGTLELELEWTGGPAFRIGAGDIDGDDGATATEVGLSPLGLKVPLLAGRVAKNWIWHWGTWPEGANFVTPDNDIPTLDDIDELGPLSDFRVTFKSFAPAPKAGDLVVTETFAITGPSGFEGQGWFELHNVTQHPINLAEISLGMTPFRPVAPSSMIDPGGYAVVGTSEGGGAGFVVDGEQIWPIPDLHVNWRGATIDTLEIMGDDAIDWPVPQVDQSVMLQPGQLSATANDAPANWCVHGLTFGSRRSPGAPNGSCGGT